MTQSRSSSKIWFIWAPPHQTTSKWTNLIQEGCPTTQLTNNNRYMISTWNSWIVNRLTCKRVRAHLPVYPISTWKAFQSLSRQILIPCLLYFNPLKLSSPFSFRSILGRAHKLPTTSRFKISILLQLWWLIILLLLGPSESTRIVTSYRASSKPFNRSNWKRTDV